jgi:hypothetical protein
MSFGGQWISRYQGTNTGTLVVDVDEVGDHLEVAACAWDDNPQYPSSLVSIPNMSRAISQRIDNLPVIPVDTFGRALTPEQTAALARQGIDFPRTATVQLDFKESDRLSVSWTTSIGTQAVANASRSRAGKKSDWTPLGVRSWSSFKQFVNNLDQKRYAYRGQSSNIWRLRTSFHRTGRANLARFENIDLKELYKVLSALTLHAFNLTDPLHNAAFINLLQHHGYPTPLLDWTWSPYIAAFFAFRNVDPKRVRRADKVRIFKLDVAEWNRLVRSQHLFPARPSLTVVDALALDNPRSVPQQSISTFSTVDDIETHVRMTEEAHRKTYLEVIDLRAQDRGEIFRELALMGITAGSLFPGIDGACEALRERNF